jgi:hypothetical protein
MRGCWMLRQWFQYHSSIILIIRSFIFCAGEQRSIQQHCEQHFVLSSIFLTGIISGGISRGEKERKTRRVLTGTCFFYSGCFEKTNYTSASRKKRTAGQVKAYKQYSFRTIEGSGSR